MITNSAIDEQRDECGCHGGSLPRGFTADPAPAVRAVTSVRFTPAHAEFTPARRRRRRWRRRPAGSAPSSPTAKASPECWVRALHSSAPIRIRPPEKSISRVTFAVRPIRVSTPSSCSGRPLREVLASRSAGPRASSSAGDDDERDQLQRPWRRRARATAMPPSAPPANISRTRSRLTISPAANRPAAISQSSHGVHARIVPSRGAVVALAVVPRSVPDVTATPVVASLGARLPRRPVRGLGDGLAQRPRVLRRRPRRPDRRHGAPRVRPARHRRGGSARLGADRAARPGRAAVPAGAARARRRPRAAGRPGPRRRWRSSPGRPRSASGWRWCRRRWAPRWSSGRRSRWTAPRRSHRPSRARCARCPGSLDLAVGDAARTLAGLDVARWNPEVPALLAGLGQDGAGARAARRPRPAGDLGAGPGRSGWPPSSTWRWPTRRVRAVNHAQAAGARRGAAPAGRRRPRGDRRRVQLASRGEPSALASARPAMTEPMTMNRVIHDAVRRDLDRLSAALDRAPTATAARAGRTRAAYANLRTAS